MHGSLDLRDRRNAAAGVSKIYLQDLVEKGAQHFRDRNYRAALQCLDDAIEQDSEAPLLVRDKRAATHIKLDDLDSALFDAEQIIRRERTNAIGYLRLGQIVQLQGEQAKALKIYEKGLRLVSTQDSYLKTLQDSHTKLATKMAPRSEIDPLTVLPGELASIIFAHLNFRDIVNITRVCKSWHSILTRNSKLWSELDFSPARRAPSLSIVRTYVKRSGGMVRRFGTSRSAVDQKPTLFYVATHCKGLQELQDNRQFSGNSLLKAARLLPALRKLILSSPGDIPMDICIDILQECKHLEHAEFHHINKARMLNDPHHLNKPPRLRTLALNGKYTIPQHPFADAILDKLRGVQHLSMHRWWLDSKYFDDNGCSKFEGLESLDLAESISWGVPLFPTTLKELSLAGVSRTARPESCPTQNLPSLMRLSLARSSIPLNTDGLLREWLETSKGNLIELDLSHQITYQLELCALLGGGYLISVKILKLRQCLVDTDAIAGLFVKHCKSLESLDIAHTDISGVGVKTLVSGLRPKLTYLGLDFCKQTSPDAVEWARKQGLQVSFRLTEHPMRGKKVRQA